MTRPTQDQAPTQASAMAAGMCFTLVLCLLSQTLDSRSGLEEYESVLGRFVAAQREEVETDIAELKGEAERIAEETRELVGEVPV